MELEQETAYRAFVEAFDRWRHSTMERRAIGALFDPFASFDWEHLTAQRSELETQLKKGYTK